MSVELLDDSELELASESSVDVDLGVTGSDEEMCDDN